MLKMSRRLLGNAARCSALHPFINPNLQTPSSSSSSLLLLRQSQRHFSTDSDERPPQTPESPPAAADPFLQTSTGGRVYGKLFGASKFTTRTDVLNLFDGCNLTLQDVRVFYGKLFTPMHMVLQFPSRGALDAAFGIITRKGRLHKLERADFAMWDMIRPHDGKSLLLEGLPRDAIPDDVERFLSGLEYDASSIDIFYRYAFSENIRMGIIRFPSEIQAQNAALLKNRQFCRNNQISARVLL